MVTDTMILIVAVIMVSVTIVTDIVVTGYTVATLFKIYSQIFLFILLLNHHKKLNFKKVADSSFGSELKRSKIPNKAMAVRFIFAGHRDNSLLISLYLNLID